MGVLRRRAKSNEDVLITTSDGVIRLRVYPMWRFDPGSNQHQQDWWWEIDAPPVASIDRRKFEAPTRAG